MVNRISDIIKLFQDSNITEDEAIARFRTLLKAAKSKPNRRDHHDMVISEISDLDTDETMYQAFCTHCGLTSKWFHEKGLAISNLNRYICEVN